MTNYKSYCVHFTSVSVIVATSERDARRIFKDTHPPNADIKCIIEGGSDD